MNKAEQKFKEAEIELKKAIKDIPATACGFYMNAIIILKQAYNIQAERNKELEERIKELEPVLPEYKEIEEAEKNIEDEPMTEEDVKKVLRENNHE